METVTINVGKYISGFQWFNDHTSRQSSHLLRLGLSRYFVCLFWETGKRWKYRYLSE